ncbi:pyridoxal phosphate-dependent aminotransferase [Roseovarius dicentrarchi]|uniref:pyridoxal phosphate-dependent aminotransferase n=1 Tax=Roseovarius dicentrarchi TaxID=2250573 RepID=UPI000DE88276|nr:pyridoxal phosphate-dependent aminotransferase [Roseovarius dicentrarchi]
MPDKRTTPLIQSLPAAVPFVGPETMERRRGAPFAARLGANESVFGPSPRAIAAMQAASAEIWKYPDSTSYELRHALAEQNGVTPDHIVVGEGIDGLLGYLVRLMVAPGDAVVTSDGAYPTFNYHVTGYGGTLHKVPYTDDHEDPAALMARAAEVGAKLVYLANPDNPMGTWHDGAAITAALDTLPDGALLVLDEAYVEFAPAPAPIGADDPRVIRMRTFSKAHGLAGARVGYAIGPVPLIAEFEKIRNHFGMNRAAQAGALAAIRDTAWLAQVQAQVATARDEIARIALENGLTSVPSATNFVSIDCGGDGDFARTVLEGLARRDIFVRMPFAAPQNRCIRVSCGTPDDLALFAAALPGALADAEAEGLADARA